MSLVLVISLTQNSLDSFLVKIRYEDFFYEQCMHSYLIKYL